jgi:hypothetical protein
VPIQNPSLAPKPEPKPELLLCEKLKAVEELWLCGMLRGSDLDRSCGSVESSEEQNCT